MLPRFRSLVPASRTNNRGWRERREEAAIVAQPQELLTRVERMDVLGQAATNNQHTTEQTGDRLEHTLLRRIQRRITRRIARKVLRRVAGRARRRLARRVPKRSQAEPDRDIASGNYKRRVISTTASSSSPQTTPASSVKTLNGCGGIHFQMESEKCSFGPFRNIVWFPQRL